MYKYQISTTLLNNLKKIDRIITELNRQSFSKVVLFDLEQEANSQSSFSSTSIEGNPLPLTDVKRLLKIRPEKIRDTEREVTNYNDSLLWLKKKLEERSFTFDINLILEIHQRVTVGLLPKAQVGKIRREPVFVNDPRLKKTIYWPPDFGDVAILLKDLIQFISSNRHQIDPIILAGIFHRQFVVIHPFIDGNGRTVRLVSKAILADLGIDTFNLFSFESYYNRNVSAYFQNVGVRGNYYDIAKKIDFSTWLEYFSAGILDELLRVKKVLEGSNNRSSTPADVLSQELRKVLSFIESHGHIRDQDYAKITERAKATRALDFKKLIRLGYIERMGKGPATYYVLKK